LAAARTAAHQRRVVDGWLLGLAGAASIGFALAFLALAFGWIKIEPGSQPDLLWLGSYFGFSAICMLGLVPRLHSQGLSQPSHTEASTTERRSASRNSLTFERI
jgi:hypothetical protein